MGWWMWAMKNIFGSIMVRMNFPAEIAISTASNHSRRMPSEGSQSLIVFPDIHFIYTSKECEFRFNHREENLYDTTLTLLRENPL